MVVFMSIKFASMKSFTPHPIPHLKIDIFMNNAWYKRQLYELARWQVNKFYIFVILDTMAFWKCIIYIVLKHFVPTAAVYIWICV